MFRKILSLVMVLTMALSICSFALVGTAGITIGGTTVLNSGTGFVGKVELSGNIVTITATLYGSISNLSTAKFGVKYNKDKVDIVGVSATPNAPTPTPVSPTPTPIVTYQNSDFMTDTQVATYATYSNVPSGMRRTLKFLQAHSMTTYCYASVGIDLVSDNQTSINYTPSSGSEFSTVMKFRVKNGMATDLTNLKTYFSLSGEWSAPTLIVAGGKKLIPVSGNIADAYLTPSIAHLDYSAIGTDPTPAPGTSVTNPTRTAPPAMSGTTFITTDTFTSGIAGTTAAPGDTANLSNIFRTFGSDKYLYFEKTWPAPTPVGYSAANIKYNFATPASGPFTMEFDYYPVTEMNAGMNVVIFGKDSNGTSAEKLFVNASLAKTSISHIGTAAAGTSGTVFTASNTDADMEAGTATIKYKVKIYVKPEQQSYEVYVDGIRVSAYPFEYRHKGILTSSASPDYPPVGEVKFTSFYLATGTGTGTYKAGFDNITAYGGAPTNVVTPTSAYYVSPTGSDSNPGTESQPFLTLDKARNVVRSYKGYMTSDITIYLAQGDYFLPTAFQLSEQDSGANGYRIVYKNKDALGSARLIGGQNLSGWSQVGTSNIYKVSVGTGLTIGNLYENEKVARVARHPNVRKDKDYPGYLGDYLISESGDDTNGAYIKYFANDMDPTGWTLTSAARIVWWAYGGYPDWGQNYRQISSINASTRTINFATPDSVGLTKDKDRFHIENVYELMDAPGEFFYDSANGWLYYYPMDGNPNNSTILLPKTSDIIKVTGSAIGTQVHDIAFEGLYLYGTRMDTGNVATGAGIMLYHTNNIDITNCHFKNMGGHAVKMRDDNEYNSVTGCWIEHTGVGGVWIYNDLNRETYPNNKSSYHLISNNKIHDISELFSNAVANGGVTIWDTNNCEVSYSEIFNSARYAISLRGHYSTQNNPTPDNMKHYAVDNTFKYIKIYNCGTDSGDMGALHAAHCNKTGEANINYWDQITIDNVTAIPNMQDIKPNGIFLDHPNSCENQNLSNIKITNTQGIPYRTNNNPIQTLTNVSWESGFVDGNMQYSSIGLKTTFPTAYGTSTTATPAPEPTTLPDEIVIDNSDSEYSEVGAGWGSSSLTGTKGLGARSNSSNSASQYARWRPIIRNPGLYDVYVWKMQSSSTSSAAAEYKVNFRGGSVTSWANQTCYGARWEKLGRYYFDYGIGGYVTLYADAPSYTTSGTVTADAVKFVPINVTQGSSSFTDDSKAYWNFEEGSGTTAYDQTTTQQNGTLTGGAAYNTNGIIGSNVVFDGTDDYISVADHDELEVGTGDFSISIWFKRDANATTNLRLLSKGGENDTDTGYAVFGSDTGIQPVLSNGTNRIIGGATHLGVGVWNHLVVVYDRDGNMNTYLNGVLSNQMDISAMSTANIVNTRSLSIGRSNSSLYWDGEVDEVRLFQRALSQTDVDSLYLKLYDPTAYWNFEEGSGTTAYDQTTAAQNGTLTGGATYNASGAVGSSISVDGTDDYVSVTDHNELEIGTGDFSIAMWFKRDSNATTNLRLFSKGGESDTDIGYAIYGSNSTITALMCNGTSRLGVSGTHLGTGVWNHLVVVCDRDGYMKMYLNGKYVTQTDISSMSATDIVNTRNLSIGRSNSSLYWDGEFDEVRLYKKAIGPSEIFNLYSQGS